MGGFKNRYMVMEVFLDPNKELPMDDPIILTQFNVSKAIKDSILVNFGECGLASSVGSFQVCESHHEAVYNQSLKEGLPEGLVCNYRDYKYWELPCPI